MSTLTTPTRSPAVRRTPGRIVERTTTITREIFLDNPTPLPTQSGTEMQSGTETESGTDTRSSTEACDELQRTSSVADERIRGIDRGLVRLGVWLIGLGRAHALRRFARADRPSASADEIAARVDAAKAHDMRHFIGLPH